MQVLKNTLYVQTQDSWLNKDGENAVLTQDKAIKARIPLHKISGIVCFGNVLITPALMLHCSQKGITITFLSMFGRFQARVEGPLSGNVLLRRAQYQIADDPEQSFKISQKFITAKIFNHRQVVRRYLRDYGSQTDDDKRERLDLTQKRLAIAINRVGLSENNDQLLGYEGDAAREYFSVFDELIRNRQFNFSGRVRNPPTDPVNALLSFVYTLMTHECRSALETVGLDASCGFFHQLRPGRPSLALDLVEEFRPILDRFVVSLINKSQLSPSDFEYQDNGAVVLKDAARKEFLKAWHTRKQQKLNHDWFEETVPFGLLAHLQATILARHIRGDIDIYVPFLWQ